QPRYIYVAGALLAPAAGLVLSRLAHRSRYLAASCAVLHVFVGLRNARLLVQAFDLQTSLTTAEERQVLAGAQILNSPSGFGLVAVVGSGPDTVHAPTLSPDRLRQYIREGTLPSPTGRASPLPFDTWVALASLG